LWASKLPQAWQKGKKGGILYQYIIMFLDGVARDLFICAVEIKVSVSNRQVNG
jgi:hypothetical protein